MAEPVTGATVGTESPAATEHVRAGERETDLEFARRRLAAVYEQLSQAGRVIAAARELVATTGDGVQAELLRQARTDALGVAIDDYDHAAARAAEGSTP